MMVKSSVSVTHHFKLAMVLLILLLAIFRLADILYLPISSPPIDLIPDKIIIVVVLLLLFTFGFRKQKIIIIFSSSMKS